MQTGGLTPAMARIAEGITQIPSPAMSPEATAADSMEQPCGREAGAGGEGGYA